LAKKDSLKNKIRGLFGLGDPDAQKRVEYQPGEEEEAVLRDCEDLLKQAKQSKASKETIFDEAYDFVFLNKQWKNPKPVEMSDYSGNMLFSNVLHKAALTTDSRPMFNISPTRPVPITVVDPDTGQQTTIDNDTIAQLKMLIEDYGWNHWNLEQVVDESALWNFCMGTAIVKVIWDENADYGRGDVSAYNVSPWMFYVSKECGLDIQKAHYTIEAHIMRLDEIKLQWQDKGRYVRPTRDFSDLRDDKKNEASEASRFGTSDTGRPAGTTDWLNVGRGGQGAKYAVERAVVYEMWLNDDTLIEEDKEKYEMQPNPETGINEEYLAMDEYGAPAMEHIVRKKYPNGRVLFWSGNVLLDDKPNPYKDGKRPYSVCRDYTTPGSFWGTGEYEAHNKSQKAWNRIVCNIIDHINGSGVKILVDVGAVKSNKKLTSRANEIVEKNPGRNISYMVPPPLPPQYYQLLEIFKGVYDEESGLHDMSRGEKTPGLDKVGIALSLKESDFTRLRPIIRGFERFLSEIGELCICRIMQYQSVSKQYVYTDQKTGEVKSLDLSGFPANLDLFFKVNVRTNSTLPNDKSSKAALAIQLFTMQVIGPDQLLKAVEWADIPGANQEMMMQQQQMAAMQAQQMGGPPDQGAGNAVAQQMQMQAAAQNPQSMMRTQAERMQGGMPQMMSDVQGPQVLAQ
jgi:hypothetical protein